MFLGIDLGTSNSVICGIVEAGQAPRLFKTSDGADTLPSAVFVDKRGSRLYGRRALEQALTSPDSVATGFKRLMGTSTPITLDGGIILTPEECSADIIRQLISQAGTETGTNDFRTVVITVPAAFNQMQSEATLRAAERAGLIGSVKLLQEPVAAAIAAAHAAGQSAPDGKYLIYDLGGGTFDLALAEAKDGNIEIVANQGINMLGGRDLDRKLVQDVIRPWLLEHFDLPDDMLRNKNYRRLQRVCQQAAEKAKIELSARDQTAVFASGDEVKTEDLAGAEVFLDVRLTRADFEKLIGDTITRTINVAQLLLTEQGLKANDISRIVFVGGPSKIPLLRKRVSEELGIKADLSLDPLTTVAMGAAYYAAQTAGVSTAPVAANDTAPQAAAEAPVVEAPAEKPAEQSTGPSVTIPAAKTIAIKVREGEGDEAGNMLAPLLEAGTPLPAKGEAAFVAAEDMGTDSDAALAFEVFQLEFPDRLELNLCVGAFRLAPKDLPEGKTVKKGDAITFVWHMNDSGILTASVTVGGVTLPTPRFYAPQEGARSYAGEQAVAFADAVLKQGEDELSDVKATLGPMATRELDLLKHRLDEQYEMLADAAEDPEYLRQISEEARFIRQDIARMARRHAANVLQRRLGRMVAAFNRVARPYAKAEEATAFEADVAAIQTIIAASAEKRAEAMKENDTKALRDGGITSGGWYKAERALVDMRRLFFTAAWRDAGYVAGWVERLKKEAYLFPDAEEYKELMAEADAALKGDNAEKREKVMAKILSARITLGASDSTVDLANIARAAAGGSV